jgi:hypothetical protein
MLSLMITNIYIYLYILKKTNEISTKRKNVTRMKGNNDNKRYAFTKSKHRWTELEDKELINNVMKFGLNDNRIVENLSRTFEACRTRWYIKHNKNIEQKFQTIKKVKKQDEVYFNCLASSWSKDEENKLAQAIELHGTKDWNKISECINTGRSASGCYNKWGKLKYRNNSIHMQTRNLNRSTTNNQRKFIDLSNITIAFADNNSSPTTTPTATTRSSNSLETNQKNSKNMNIFNNNNKYTTEIIGNNNYSLTNPIISSVIETGSISTIYDFLYRMEEITQDKWSINDVNQLIIIMGKIKSEKGNENMREERSWKDIGDKMIKNCDDCRKVWELIQNLSRIVVGDIMINYWRTMN